VSGNVHEPKVVAIRTLARGVVEWRFETDAPFTFRPGQFFSVRVGERDTDGNPILRSYSIASSPVPGGGREFAIILKLVPGGVGSERFARLAVGDRLKMSGPMGFFCLELMHAGDVVFGATGVGIAPVLPMLRELLARPSETGRVHLFWGNREAADLFWLDELDALQAAHPRFSYRLFISQGDPAEAAPRPAAKGRITAPLLELAPTLARPIVYLVGNGAMIREVKAALVARGFERKRQIRSEQFFD
jgi:ferredoxin-NADP reductase